MSARIEPDGSVYVAPLALDPAVVAAIAAEPTIDADDLPALPSDHPPWMRDTISLSSRARALLIAIKPIAIRIVTCWEHRVRSIVIGTNRLSIDQSGSYRLN